MAKFALLCVAVVCGGAFSAPTSSNTFPDKYTGTYQVQPEKDQNFVEFLTSMGKGHEANEGDLQLKTGMFSIYKEKDSDTYHVKKTWGGNMPVHELTFKLGEKTTTTFNGKTIEYEYTVENGDSDSPVLKGKFRCVETDKKYTVDVTFTPKGANAVYNTEGVTAKRTALKVPCPSTSGFYVNVPEKQSANFLDFIQKVVPAPKGISWDDKSGLWLGRWKGDLIVKYIITPSVSVKFPFKLDEERTKEIDGHNVTYKYHLVSEDSTTHTTVMHSEFDHPSGKLEVTSEITPEGIKSTYKQGDQTATRFWKRCTSPMVYGSYESVPEHSENWSEFATAVGKEDDSKELTKLQIYKKDKQLYFRVQYTNGKTMAYPIELNKTVTNTLPNGTPIKYTWNETPHYTGEPAYRAEYEMGDKKFTADMYFNATGMGAIYKTGSITAKRCYRRILPTIVLGKFETTETTPEFEEFTKAIGSPELLKKTTVETTEPKTGEQHGKYEQTITVEGGETPGQFPFELGMPRNVTVKGKTMTYTYFYFDHPVPVLHVHWREIGGPSTFSVASEFTPTGTTATYMHKGKIATRKYTRTGSPVERETYPTA